MAIAALVVSSSACQGGWTEIISSGLHTWGSADLRYYGVTDSANGHSYFAEGFENDADEGMYRTDGATATQITSFTPSDDTRIHGWTIANDHLVAGFHNVTINHNGHYTSSLPVDPTTPTWNKVLTNTSANSSGGDAVDAPDLPSGGTAMTTISTSSPTLLLLNQDDVDTLPTNGSTGVDTPSDADSHRWFSLCRVDDDYVGGYLYKTDTVTHFYGMDPSAWTTFAYGVTWTHGAGANLKGTGCLGWDAKDLLIQVLTVAATPKSRIAVLDSSGNFDIQQAEDEDLRPGVIWDNGDGELAYIIDSDTGELWTSNGVDDFAVVSNSATDSGVEHDALVLCPHRTDAICALGSNGSLWMWAMSSVLRYPDTSIWSSIKSSVR